MSKDPGSHENDNHANQCNPNHDEYWHSRGWEDGRPDDWADRVEDNSQPE